MPPLHTAPIFLMTNLGSSPSEPAQHLDIPMCALADTPTPAE